MMYVADQCAVFYRVKEEFGVFSNFSPDPIVFAGVEYPTSEHFYQAMKFDAFEYSERVRTASTPKESKTRAHAMLEWARPDWLDNRINVMTLTLELKWQQCLRFREALALTGDRPIVEKTRTDDFWGAIEVRENLLRGENWLGRLLVDLREDKAGWHTDAPR